MSRGRGPCKTTAAGRFSKSAIALFRLVEPGVVETRFAIWQSRRAEIFVKGGPVFPLFPGAVWLRCESDGKKQKEDGSELRWQRRRRWLAEALSAGRQRV